MKLKKFFVDEIPRRKFLETGIKGGIALAATPSLLMQLVSCKSAQPQMFMSRTGYPGVY